MVYLAALSVVILICSLVSLGNLSRQQGEFYSRSASNAQSYWTVIGLVALFSAVFCLIAAIF